MFNNEQRPETKAGVRGVNWHDKTILVTGSTSGVGREAALALGRLGADVVVHGRRENAGNEVVTELEDFGSEAWFISADFTSLEDISQLAETVMDNVSDIDVLCNNAGGLFEPVETDLGVEKNFHVNHLAPYLLTAELLPVLADGGRVVTTASIGHRVGTLNLDSVAGLMGLSDWAAYCRSKLANVQFANELSRRLVAAGRDVTSNSFHPGIIPGSEFSRALPEPASMVGRILGEFPVTDSVEDGAATLVYLAASDEVEGITGRYFVRCRDRRPAPDATDVEAQGRLWSRSAEMLDIEEPLADAVTEE